MQITTHRVCSSVSRFTLEQRCDAEPFPGPSRKLQVPLGVEMPAGTISPARSIVQARQHQPPRPGLANLRRSRSDTRGTRRQWRLPQPVVPRKASILARFRSGGPAMRGRNIGVALQIGILMFPAVQQLDLTGRYEVFASLPDAKVHLVARSLDLVTSATGLILAPTVTFADCPRLDVLCIPGGAGKCPTSGAGDIGFCPPPGGSGAICHFSMHRCAGARRRRATTR